MTFPKLTQVRNSALQVCLKVQFPPLGLLQVLNLQKRRCAISLGVVEHEMFHALGSFHEHSRTDRLKLEIQSVRATLPTYLTVDFDRDQHVTINWANIAKGWKDQFKKYKSSQVHSYGSYDPGSVMHYSRCAASKNNRETISAKVPGTPLGQRNGMSSQDWSKLMTMYSCNSGK